MAEATEYEKEWSEVPTPQIETVADRLQALERMVADLTQRADRNGHLPDGLAAGPGGLLSGASLVPTSAADLPGTGERGFWTRFAFWKELQLIFQMYFDPRYRLSRVCQIGVPVILSLMVVNYFLLGQWFPLIGFLLERIALVILAVALYKLLAWESTRYAAVLRYLTQYGR